MSWEEALDIVVSRTNHARYRELCADGHPGREAWRARVIEKAALLVGSPALPPPVPGGPAPRPPAEYPPPTTQVGNLASSLWDWACSGFRMASEAEQARRLALCEACPEWLPIDRRCGKCLCFMDAKVHLKTAKCPIGKW